MRFEPLQVGRGIAALAVVVHHAAISATGVVGGAPAWAWWCGLGAHGVDFFFVLSGFIIYWVTVDRVDDPHWLRRYVASRAVRIYVPYIPVGVGLGLLYAILSHSERSWSWLSTLTLLPGPTALLPAWTLQHEIAFYALMALLFALRRVGQGIAAWGILLVLLNIGGGPGSPPLLSRIDIEFIIGVGAACAVKNGYLPFALGFLRRAMPRPAVYLGDASYSIYLIHAPLMSLTSRLVLHAGGDWYAAAGLGVAASVAAGLAFHRWYEAPALAMAKQLLRRRQRGSSSA